MADKVVRLLLSDPGISVKFVDLEDGTYALAVSDQAGGAGGDGLTDTELRATPIEVVSGEAEGGWIPRSDDANVDTPIPGVYIVCTLANTAYKVDRPTGSKSILVWFAAADALQTPLDGRISFTRDETSPTVTATGTGMGFHPPLPIEYSLPTNVTDVYFASGTAGRVAVGMWTYE
jgi:hypothetical protein